MTNEKDDPAVDGDPFWRFSIRLYASEGAEAACLSLQDDHAVDVVLALFALWVGFRRSPLDAGAEERAAALSTAWTTRAVRPLRAIRRDLKRGVEGIDWSPIRERVKALELEAERAQHQALQRIAETASTAASTEPTISGREAASAAFDRLAALSGLAVRACAPSFQTLLACAESLDDVG